MPLTLVAIVWRPTAVWCRRLSEGLIAIILSKFVLAVAFTLAAGALGDATKSQGGGLSALVAGGAVLLVAGLAPWVLIRMIPLTQLAPELGLNRQHLGSVTRNAPAVTMATGATRMLMQGRFAPAAAAATPAVPSGARRDDSSTDPPVAVIPNPKAERADA
jgi:hypothetical protein